MQLSTSEVQWVLGGCVVQTPVKGGWWCTHPSCKTARAKEEGHCCGCQQSACEIRVREHWWEHVVIVRELGDFSESGVRVTPNGLSHITVCTLVCCRSKEIMCQSIFSRKAVIGIIPNSQVNSLQGR